MPGNPDEPLPRYDAMGAEITPPSMRLHLCLRTPDGIVMVDTCPNKELFNEFVGGEGFGELLERYGLPEPDQLEDFTVHAVFVDGAVR